MKKVNTNDAFIRKRMLRQRRRRRRRLIIFLILFIIILIISGVVLCLTIFFPIDNIKSKGSIKYNSQMIIDSSGITLGSNLFMLSSDKTVNNIKEKLPFVEKVSIKRYLPGTIEIAVTDAKECFVISKENNYYTVSKKWNTLEHYDKLPKNLIEIKGLDIKCNVGENVIFPYNKYKSYIDKIMKITDDNSYNINYIDFSDELNIVVKTDNRFVVSLGTVNNLDQKFLHLSGMIKNIDKSKTGKIDLSMWTNENTEGTFVEGEIE